MVRHLTLLCVTWQYCAPVCQYCASLGILSSFWLTVRHSHCDEGLPNAAGCPPLAAVRVHGPAPGTRGLPQATRLPRGTSVQRGDSVGSGVRWTHQDPLCRRWVCISSPCRTVRQPSRSHRKCVYCHMHVKTYKQSHVGQFKIFLIL